ncbi:MAG: Na+/H+ antiporter subunit E [Acidimicrobiia bacterium]|nr:Na+/H+ antiporter subunit E [Acidimicrobiia bacterium]
MLLANIVLALLWSIMVGSVALANLSVGFVIGYALLALIGGGRRSRYIRHTWAGVSLVAFTVYELILANVRVAWYTVSDLRALEPAVLAVPLEPGLSDGELSLLAVLVTLTPGTLSLDVADDRRSLYVHFMHVDDPGASIRVITDGFERRILELTR